MDKLTEIKHPHGGFQIEGYEIVRETEKAWHIKWKEDSGILCEWFPKSRCWINVYGFVIDPWIMYEKFGDDGRISEDMRDKVKEWAFKNLPPRSFCLPDDSDTIWDEL